MPEFSDITKHNNSVKPVFILTVDGGPDENPRYEKVVNVAIHHFAKLNLDVLLLAANSPKRSCFNRVERRMAPLSRELAGVILQHDRFGTHLNAQGETIDEELERKNFQFAGQTLAQIWSEMVIDKHPVIAEYISPENSETDASDLIKKDAKWKSLHDQTSQYFTQIVKCRKEECCGKPRSNIFELFPDFTFMPPPIALEQNDSGVVAARKAFEENGHFASLFMRFSLNDIVPDDLKVFGKVPYDLYCPSVTKMIKSRVCSTCGKYFASMVMLKEHTKHLHGKVTIPPKIRPKRIAARRANELLAIVARDGVEEAEWIDAANVYDSGESISNIKKREEEEKKQTLPVVSIEKHMTQAWTNE